MVGCFGNGEFDKYHEKRMLEAQSGEEPEDLEDFIDESLLDNYDEMEDY